MVITCLAEFEMNVMNQNAYSATNRLVQALNRLHFLLHPEIIIHEIKMRREAINVSFRYVGLKWKTDPENPSTISLNGSDFMHQKAGEREKTISTLHFVGGILWYFCRWLAELITDGWNVSRLSHKHYELSRNLVLCICVISPSYSEFNGSHCWFHIREWS
jgi:hypothetical protein